MPSYEELKSQADREWRAGTAPARPQIFVGTATCGRAAGGLATVQAIKAELARRGIAADVYEVGCIGLCYAEPLVDVSTPGKPRIRNRNTTSGKLPQLIDQVMVQGNLRPDLALGAIDAALDGIRNIFDLPEMKLQVRAALRNCGIIDPVNIFHYIARGGYSGLHKALSSMKPDQVLEEVTKSGLRGRGGAAFSTGQKWKFLAGSREPVKYMLCNAEEGDPGAFNDKALLESDPQSVLEGMTIAGYATGAPKGYVFIRCVHFEVIRRTEAAIEQAYKHGLLGKNILGTSFSFDIEVAQTGESYVSGEETALMEAIEGRRAMPRARPPFPAQVGLWGKPSNINNVKTFASVPIILEKGGAWYASIGTEKSKGTALVCLSGHINKPGLYEVPFGVTLREVLETCGGGVAGGSQIKLLQTGGPLGGVLGGSEIDVKLDFDEMAAKGAILGSGGVIVGNEHTCVVDMIRILADFNQEESCGKCFPCRLGTRHVWEILSAIAEGKGKPGDIEKMLQIGDTMVSSLCGHGQLAGNPVRSAVKYFGKEIEAHITEKVCPAGQCSALAARAATLAAV